MKFEPLTKAGWAMVAIALILAALAVFVISGCNAPQRWQAAEAVGLTQTEQHIVNIRELDTNQDGKIDTIEKKIETLTLVNKQLVKDIGNKVGDLTGTGLPLGEIAVGIMGILGLNVLRKKITIMREPAQGKKV